MTAVHLLRGKIIQVLHVVSMLVKVVSVQTPLLLKVLLQLILQGQMEEEEDHLEEQEG